MLLNQEYKITYAKPLHINEMMEIANSNLIDNKLNYEENIQKCGFLITNPAREIWQEIVADNDKSLALIAKLPKNNTKDITDNNITKEHIIGYLTGFTIDKTEMRFQEKVLFLLERQNVKDLTAKKDIFYYSQIAKRQNYYNVGKGLVLSMFEELRKRKISIIICRIIHGPIKNEKSISFHQKLGFYCIGDVDYNNYQIGIYFKKL